MKGKDKDSPSKRKRKNPFFKSQKKEEKSNEKAPNDSDGSFEFVDCSELPAVEPKPKNPKPSSSNNMFNARNTMTAAQRERFENLRHALREYMDADPTTTITIVRDGNVMGVHETIDQIVETGDDEEYFVDMPLGNLAELLHRQGQKDKENERRENLNQIRQQIQENFEEMAVMIRSMNGTVEKTKNKLDRTFTNARKTEHYGRFLMVSDLQRRERNNEPELPFKDDAPENLFFRRIEQAYGHKLHPNYRFVFQCPQCEYITNGEQNESEEEAEDDNPLPYDHPAKKDRFNNDFDHDQGGSGSGIAA